jgi:indolepyruvate ferredoxin oxidoreductase beta subunit
MFRLRLVSESVQIKCYIAGVIMNGVTSVFMVGVGGQGIVLAGNVLCSAAMYAGYDVKLSKVHGLAQRGGSVVSHIRFGNKVYSPMIPQGGTDYMLSFERMEFLRYVNYVGENCTLIMNSGRIFPMPVAMGLQKYPDEIINKEKSRFAKVCEFDANTLAIEAGNLKAVSMVILGNLAAHLNFGAEAWEKAIRDNLPNNLVELNDKAFKAGKVHA